jgi:hypothetical protein
MCGAARGEHIAREAAEPNDQERPGAETLRRCLTLTQAGLPAGAEEARRKLIETLGHRRLGVSPGGKVRERRSGEIPVKAFVGNLGRVKPKGASSGWRTKHTLGRQGLLEGLNPRNCGSSSRPSHLRVRRYTDERNGMWVLPAGNGPDTFREEKAPKGESQERCRYETRPARVTKGVNRHEGSQTLKTERSGQAKARGMWTFEPCMCCREAKPMRGVCRLRPTG